MQVVCAASSMKPARTITGCTLATRSRQAALGSSASSVPKKCANASASGRCRMMYHALPVAPQQLSASAACSAVLNLPKSVDLHKVAKLLVRYQAAGDQGGIKLQAVHRTPNLLQVLQAIGVGLALPGVDIIVNEGVCRQGPGVRL